MKHATSHKAYGVWHAWGLDAYNIARPAVFLIDPIRRDSLLVRRQPAEPSSRRMRRSWRK